MVPRFGAAKQTGGVTTLAVFSLCSSGVERATRFHCEVRSLGVNQLVNYFICCEASFFKSSSLFSPSLLMVNERNDEKNHNFFCIIFILLHHVNINNFEYSFQLFFFLTMTYYELSSSLFCFVKSRPSFQEWASTRRFALFLSRFTENVKIKHRNMTFDLDA